MITEMECRDMTKEELTAISIYWEKNKKVLCNPVIRGFFEDKANVLLLARHLVNPSKEASSKLEGAFLRYFFRVRFTKYLCSLIRYCDIDYHRKRTRDELRYPLVFDALMGDGESTIGEILYSTAIEEEIPISDPKTFQQSFNDDSLFYAFNRLTDKQKLIITLAYSTSAIDNEIARLLHISQQAITKTRQTALKKMRNNITDRQQESHRN
ncbi:sigma-70 family RNA polymerase sigma factor [Paenibacillus sediminis]|uniref:DNA-directed RNA polymerase specialized sigma24 family protein n=1 Tax=Paenibacillus sediminis TaxID=664909 RepID=A0ABS4H3P3_9BACL|nr:sigma-70 family RNA polymerase sigma factor [Paenibacillus sediminis]MBP1937157.1 DNA-directed RNA polymerase specialized sigma24 family protein [Paenibacillus sediminis]